MREQVAKLSRGNDLVKAMQYMLKRWPAFTLFLEDGRVCLSNNAAERGLRGIAFGKKIVVVLPFRPRGPACGRHVQPHRDGEDERRRSADLARRRSLAYRRASRSPAGRVAAVELAHWRLRVRRRWRPEHARQQGRSRHDRRARAARLGENVDFIHDVALEMDTEDGVVWVYGVGDDGVLAFTDFGIETLVELIEVHKDLKSRAGA